MTRRPFPTTRTGRTLTSAVLLGVLLTGCTASTTSVSLSEAETTTAQTDEGSAEVVQIVDTDVFDSSVLHDVDLTIDEADLVELLETYQSTGDKDWASATITIDGQTFSDVGVRLKGNSSLRAADTSSDPAELPWLIRLDKYIDGQSLDGYTEFVVRSNASETSLNEAVALDLLALAGLASEHAIATAFSVNGEQAQLRLVVQNLDETWEEENFTTDGLLYKAESTGDYTYRGDDPDAYDDVFDQETGDEDTLEPLIGFLDFINNSSDEDFAAELGDLLDVNAFATYLAFEDLIGNGDAIDGPGNNSFLRWDETTGQFTVVAWDHNEVLGVGPGGTTGAVPGAPGGTTTGGQAGLPPGGPGGLGGPGGNMQPNSAANPLVERFLANDEFEALYDEATVHLQALLYGSGAADEILQQRVDVLTSQASDLVDAGTVASEAQTIAGYFTR